MLVCAFGSVRVARRRTEEEIDDEKAASDDNREREEDHERLRGRAHHVVHRIRPSVKREALQDDDRGPAKVVEGGDTVINCESTVEGVRPVVGGGGSNVHMHHR
jgi:hypothetical protein